MIREIFVYGLLGSSITGVANSAPLAQTMTKIGSCPSEYYSSSNYCVPSGENAMFALPKVGSCPSGYHTSGDYCVASSKGSKTAITKLGSCPNGFYSSGNYCLSTK